MLLCVGLLMRVCYPKLSSSPYANFLSDLISWKTRSKLCIIVSHKDFVNELSFLSYGKPLVFFKISNAL